jgi:hypothetical protein
LVFALAIVLADSQLALSGGRWRSMYDHYGYTELLFRLIIMSDVDVQERLAYNDWILIWLSKCEIRNKTPEREV